MTPEEIVSNHPQLAALYVSFYAALSAKEAAERDMARINQAIQAEIDQINAGTKE